MRYLVSIEVAHADGQAPPDDASEALLTELRRELNKMPRWIRASDVVVAKRQGGILLLEATLAGVDSPGLTNPRDALTHFDLALDSALNDAGLFEEFDVARKRLTVQPW